MAVKVPKQCPFVLPVGTLKIFGSGERKEMLSGAGKLA
jgi:hypothetical protein